MSLSNHLLHNFRINLDRRLRVVESYIVSKGLFQCSTWPQLYWKDFR